MHNKIHKFLLDYYQFVGEKKIVTNNGNVEKMEARMFRLDAGQKSSPRQYR